MNKEQSYEKTITVIGGGPSGMMAAVSAARYGKAKVRILEKNDFLGKKLLATGNGRCNLTNINSSGACETLELFNELGLLTRVEAEGRVYPYSGQASAVQEVLVNGLNKLKVEILCGVEVKTLETKEAGGFLIAFDDKMLHSDKSFYPDNVLHSDAVILATGGKAGPQYGSTGDGYRLAKALGHTMIRTMPSLVQMVSDQPFFSSLKGVRAKGQAELLRLGEVIDSENGEIQFTGDGLSGICVFNLSKNYLHGDMVRIDLFPEFSAGALETLMAVRSGTLQNSTIHELLAGMLHQKLIPVLLDEISLDESRTAGGLSPEEILKMVRLLKGWTISITGTKGWKEAQVTSGGVELSEVDPVSMESRLAPKLFFAGELLNVDEKCGGYNLQWAWSSGFAAGKSAALAVAKKTDVMLVEK